MSASLELSWIRNVDKSLVLPVVLFESVVDYGGCYYHPRQGEILIGEKHYDRRNGIIVISTEWPESFQGTLAHEWRHHWQHYQGWKNDSPTWNCPNGTDYDSAIRAYFKQSKSEADALRFELKNGRNHINDHWLGLLSKS